MENNKIVIENPNQCIKILNTILDNTYPQERIKYASYVAMNYFVKNLNSFNKQYIEKILSHETLGISISAKFSYELLENAVNNNLVFPAYNKKWFNNIKSNQELLEKYLAILVKSSDSQQIEDFCHINPVLSKNYYLSNYPDNYTFEKCVIANNPMMIINKRQLKEDDVIDLIQKDFVKYEHVKRILSKFSRKVQTLVSQEQIKLIKNYNLSQENKTDLIDLLSENAAFFIKELQDIDKNFTKKLLSANGGRENYDNTSSQLNILQSIIVNNIGSEDKLKEIVAVCLYPYKDIFMKDIKVFLGEMEYEYQNSFLLFNYQRMHFKLFKSLSYFNDNLTTKEKDIVISANFDNLLQNYDYKKNFPEFNFEMMTYIEPLTYFKHEELNKKIQLLKAKDNIENSLVLEVEKYLLHNKLNEKLIEKNTNEKRMKI